MDVMKKIRQQVESNPVLIYMKGTPEMPQCGFSANAVNALNSTGVAYAYINVLEDPWIFEKLPAYANWPTFPQIYVGGELVGGGDIVVEMATQGTLKTVLEEAVASAASQTAQA